MFLSYEFFATFSILLSNLIFFVSYIPQIVLNYKLKSTRGLSDFYILLGLYGQIAYVTYVFSSALPLIYKFTAPLFAIVYLVIVIQRFWYASFKINKKILTIYLVNFLLLIFVIFFLFLFFNNFLCNILGWFSVFTSSWKKFPQMLKVFLTRSVKGFSLGYISIGLIGYSFELAASLLLELPMPVLINDFRGLLVYIVFLIQFWFFYARP